ncbi:hypothetical protein KC19_1G139300 [Ceratodon purpureus]|uniref:GDP-Man:Man(3)GlcNAc(2)-PP-Dol alpha-1,2-mannosyltransferase n=1 Tax=Ceratodon purpureus TaxID=3225 RepID=A0A8T0J5U8_CERPU|nr:hypothetical protein KC19_1G139300 [Ceratodon purpureus]
MHEVMQWNVMELWRWQGLVAGVLGLVIIFSGMLLAGVLLWGRRRRQQMQRAVAFFHPRTEDGGGGERVLWCAVRAVQELAPELSTVVYTVDVATPESLAARALDLFGVKLPRCPSVVMLQKGSWIEPKSFRRFTILFQSVGSMVLAWEALSKLTPVLFVDTSGYAFTYAIARVAGSFVACYTHYPTISTDMLARVCSRASSYNNDTKISSSFWLSTAKVWYYRLLAQLYGWAGRCAHVGMVNSSWTYNHIIKLWRSPDRIFLVYPPCDTLTLEALPLDRPKLQLPYIISVAGFRPEKAHTLQLLAFGKALEKLSLEHKRARLKLVGYCRPEDEQRIQSLRDKCKELGLEPYVEFHLRVGDREKAELLGGAIGGLHTMADEHFGISVVEYMAAGVVPIAHNSAGPKLDIVVDEGGQKPGFLATSISEYAEAIYQVLTMPNYERLKLAEAAKLSASRFSESRFNSAFKKAMGPLLDQAVRHTSVLPKGR